MDQNKPDIADRRKHFAAKSPLMAKLRDAVRVRGLALNTERAYVAWVVDFIFWHSQRHPGEMGAPEVTQYLTHLATVRNVAASTQNQAMNAIVFLYGHVLCKPLGDFGEVPRAKRRKTLAEWLTVEDTAKVLGALAAEHALPVKLLYGAGLRLHECVTLRLKDLDFALGRITIHDAKGGKDRLVPLPSCLAGELQAQVRRATAVHSSDAATGQGGVFLPDALERKFPAASKSLAWFWLWPAKSLATDPRSGVKRRHHIHDSALQKATSAAVKRAGITGRRITPHVFRHSFCTALLESGTPVHEVQAIMGHSDVNTTLAYAHALPSRKLVSPLDTLMPGR